MLILGFLPYINQAVAQEDILPPLRKSVTLFGGAALPTGEFAAASGKDAGFAKTGFVLGVENSAEAVRHFLVGLEVNASSMPIDAATAQSAYIDKLGTNNLTVDAGSWLIVGVLGDVGFGANLGSSVYLYGKGKLGLAFGNTPQISLQVNNEPVTQNSASASAFAFGFGFGVIANNAFDIGVHFLSLTPEYRVTTIQGGTSTVSNFSQPTSVFQLRVGYSISLN